MKKLIFIGLIFLAWRAGIITVYHNKFEGRRCADGSIFSHKKNQVAMNGIKLGSILEVKYGGRMVKVVVRDRGTRYGCLDVSRGIVKRLGLYRLKNGKTDRQIYWRKIK
jgi:rare lipoprotein A (peptidoglycan hydrolase)